MRTYVHGSILKRQKRRGRLCLFHHALTRILNTAICPASLLCGPRKRPNPFRPQAVDESEHGSGAVDRIPLRVKEKGSLYAFNEGRGRGRRTLDTMHAPQGRVVVARGSGGKDEYRFQNYLCGCRQVKAAGRLCVFIPSLHSQKLERTRM
ncbi:hypothetical protein HYPSUDRAFT_51960 [Hypholoma sublateritium FD-334 SS-4]|uniref:Uncharacterized protein n=1 Tax=Hypholoma sublateritium (strain FD-334 SS-4) TaxID=945553 RepID=A0A0D2MTU7_HYPSF|nr:hypothetical protein HYPSUDRAFT_51960 [Hypholoma sublateritium FD-334 SS-4]